MTTKFTRVLLAPLAAALVCAGAAAQSPSMMGHSSMGHSSMGHSSMGHSSMSHGSSKMVGGAAMLPSRNIVENASHSKDHTTLVAAVKAAGLVATLEGPGPFTVFAPTNEAFAKLPSGTVASLLKPENKAKLVKVLTYHVVAGKYSAARIESLIKSGHGKAVIKTVAGDELSVYNSGKRVKIVDEKGRSAYVTIADVNQSNGVIHVINAVLLP